MQQVRRRRAATSPVGRALIVEHHPDVTAGMVEDRLIERGYEIVRHRVVTRDRIDAPDTGSADFPEPSDVDVVVLLGAPWGVYERDVIGTWLAAEADFALRAHAADVPVLGICFGGQLLAEIHGGEVYRSDRPEIGWTEITSSDESLVPSGRWFEWHQDTWRLPPDAVEIAASADASQAFHLGRNIAVQFHPEMDTRTLTHILAGHGGPAALARGIDPATLLAATHDIETEARARTDRLVDGFLRLTRPASTVIH